MTEVETAAVTENTYERSLRIIVKFASLEGINVPQNMIENWTSLFDVIRVTDKHIDSLKSEDRINHYNNILAILDGTDPLIFYSSNTEMLSASRKMYSLFGSLDQNDQNSFKNATQELFTLNEKMKASESAGELATLRRIEGQVSVRLLEIFTDKNIKQQKEWPRFRKILKLLARLGNTIDTLIDWRIDYGDGQLAIPPFAGNKLLFASSGLFSDVRQFLNILELKEVNAVVRSALENKLYRLIQ